MLYGLSCLLKRCRIKALMVASLFFWATPLQAQQWEKPVLLDMTQVRINGNPFDSFTATSLAWSSDGKKLAVGGEAQDVAEGSLPWPQGWLVQLWDVTKRACYRTFEATPTPSNGIVAELAWAPDQTFLVARHSSLELGSLADAQTWNMRGNHVTTIKTKWQVSPARSLSVATGTPHLAADRQTFALVRCERRANKRICIVERRSFSTGKLVSTHLFPIGESNPNDTDCAALSGDSRTLAILSGPMSKKWVVNLFDTYTSKPLRHFDFTIPQPPSHLDPAHQVAEKSDDFDFQTQVAFSRDGSTLAALVGSSSLILMNSLTGVHRSTIQTPDDMQAFAISDEGKYLAILETKGRFTLWDTHTGKLVRVLASPSQQYGFAAVGDSDSQPLHELAFSPDSSLLAIAVYNNTVALWRIH